MPLSKLLEEVHDVTFGTFTGESEKQEKHL
jgi:hypothetical protein